ncbi:MAG TPA: SIS domain-containing protein [Deltaproteobacteria bacterium]|nr:SIS domain-containing protein [Deltaproteobacteria bacterium]
MNFADYSSTVLKEIEQTLKQVDGSRLSEFSVQLWQSPKVFVAGAGRTGLVMRCFAMRLMHLGLYVQILGDTLTGAMKKEDCLLIGSGSGETPSLVSIAEKAQELGVRIVLFGLNPDSSIGKLASDCLRIPAPSPKLNHAAACHSIQPMGSLFEQSLLLTLDSLVGVMMHQKGMNSKSMFLNHANVE